MSEHLQSNQFVLDPPDNLRLANLCGQFDEHLRQIERSLGVEINNRGNRFQVIGEDDSVRAAGEVLNGLYAESANETLSPAQVHLFLQGTGLANVVQPKLDDEPIIIRTRRGQIKPRTPNQQRYVKAIQNHDINFGVGPAGTGKTYLAVATAVEALERDEVRRILLVRPAVEAGERLGFLPGDLAQKVDPYLRPLYDALYEMLGFEKVAKLTERNVIEVAPLAYMRGRTLNESFVILDEAQNTSVEQMKMFLTRIGFGSKAVITGDVTQIDLPTHQKSGLRHVIEVLKDVDGISFNFFLSRDVVRHPLVARIVNAYEDYEQANPAENKRRP
ncbi:PhoH family protein [Sulfuriflexus sp.]|uniref:PhoH family protein n=1 Tax=Sulfuriflexus sp. TaxID=2015443 RepID=UPI0028CBE634|nr:PhoH family protein [Sulfuriflexus sp.]MDT8405374.1 PhoH family protein [Sulfuriflexus sp.]